MPDVWPLPRLLQVRVRVRVRVRVKLMPATAAPAG